MIDLHSHILPELDDGARDLRDAIAMARMAAQSGVTVMAATPHCADDRVYRVRAAWQLLSQALEENGIPVKLVPGMEIFSTADTARMLREGKLLTLNNSRYPLIEFSFRSDGNAETAQLHSVCQAGFRPLIAHPERYPYVQRHPELLNLWHDMGCLLQINRGSLLGRFGTAARQLAWALVDRGFAAVVASDAHSPRQRTPWLADVWQLLETEFSPLCARMLLKNTPRAILNNEDLPPVSPVRFE